MWLVESQQNFSPGQERAVTGGLVAAGLSSGRTLSFSGIDVVEYSAVAGPVR